MKSTDSHFARSWNVALRLNGHLLGCWKQISASLRGEGTFQTMLTDCLTLSCQGLEPSALLDPEECQMYWPAPNEVLSTWWDFPGFLKQLVNKQCVNELTWDEDPSAPAKPPNTYKAHGLSEPLMWSSLVSLAHKSRKDDVFVLRHQFGAQFVIQPIDASNKSHIWKEVRVSGKLGRLGTALCQSFEWSDVVKSKERRKSCQTLWMKTLQKVRTKEGKGSVGCGIIRVMACAAELGSSLQLSGQQGLETDVICAQVNVSYEQDEAPVERS